MSARANKKLNKISKKPVKRAAAKDHPPKRPAGRSPSAKAGSKPLKAVPKLRAKPARKPKKAIQPVKVSGKASVGSGAKSKAQVAKQREVERRNAEKARAQAQKAREVAKKLAEQTRQRDALARAAQKQKEADARRREAERVVAQKQKVAALKQKEAERRVAQKLKDAEQKKKEAERQRLALELQKRHEAEQKARELDKDRKLAEKAAAKEAQRQAAEDEKLRKQQERDSARLAKERERTEQKAAREAEREELRRQKEEEREKREAEREAYRKAKEAEREKIRAVKEAARRALEGRIAEATRNANKLGGGRSTTTRIYSPKAIPDQSGTTRRILTPAMADGLVNAGAPTDSEPPGVDDATAAVAPSASGTTTESPSKPATETSATPEEEAARAAERAHPIPENVEDRYRVIEERLKAAPDGFNRDYRETIDMSWIHHDSALEGVVYTFQELKTAIDPASGSVADSSLQPVIEEIRRHKQAIDLVRDLGERKRAPITVDTIKKIYVTLHPEEGDIKTVKYRRDIPQHRLYFHEYSHPEKITYKVRQVVDWLNGPEPKKLKSPIRVAARVHYELLRVFPFQTDSGKVARLVMNLMLLRAGHPPTIIHSTERQRYYEALKGALPVLVQMVTESVLNALGSIEKLLDDHDIRVRT